MSTLLRPVGPESARTYWRRRLALLLLVVAVIAFVVVLIAQPWAGKAQPEPPASAPAPQVTSTPAAVPAPAPSSQPGAPAAAAQSAAPAPASQPPTCAPADVQVRAVTDSDSYSAGQQPQLSFTVTNTSSSPCVLNAGTAKQVYTITSGNEVYWRSTDCQTGATDTLALLAPGVEVPSASIAWDRTRSAPDTCDGDRKPVPAGGASYHLTVTVDGRQSAQSKQFLLY